jgi:hypothetical protein
MEEPWFCVFLSFSFSCFAFDSELASFWLAWLGFGSLRAIPTIISCPGRAKEAARAID